MSGPGRIYGTSLSLLTDLYELTMAYGYWKSGNARKEAVFSLFFRESPFGGGFGVACGLGYVVDYLNGFRFTGGDIEYLAGLSGGGGGPLFERGFLDFLAEMELCCDVDGVPEGTVVFPREPLLRVAGPLVQCQILETALLNMVNFQTLVATKSARVRLAAGDDPVLEFGLRRAQGIDGGVAASRAAYIGGCDGTSNVLAGKLFGIPVRGTHAHSWVMSFDSELEAFRVYAEVMPENCIFLVDTYDTLEGVRNAVRIGGRLREQGHEMLGIRLDSGDIGRLSREARKILDEAGFGKALVVASGDLDEYAVEELKRSGAPVDVWGVGTRLVTGHGQSALGGVYKLVAVRNPGEEWSYRVKLSEDASKASVPGILQVRRFHDSGRFLCDLIYDGERGPGDGSVMVKPGKPAARHTLPAGAGYTDLLVPVFRGGKQVCSTPDVESSRRRTLEHLSALPPEVKRLGNPERYPVGFEPGLYELGRELAARYETCGGGEDSS